MFIFNAVGNKSIKKDEAVSLRTNSSSDDGVKSGFDNYMNDNQCLGDGLGQNYPKRLSQETQLGRICPTTIFLIYWAYLNMIFNFFISQCIDKQSLYRYITV